MFLGSWKTHSNGILGFLCIAWVFMHKRVYFSCCVLPCWHIQLSMSTHIKQMIKNYLDSHITFKQFVQNTIHLQILRIEAQTKKWYTNKTMCHNETCIKTQKLTTINLYLLSLLMRHTPNSHFNWFQINIQFGILT